MTTLRLWPLLFLLAAGCGDSFTDLVNEEAALANEFADTLIKVSDEQSADRAQKYVVGKLKNKLKAVKERKARFNKNTSIDRVLAIDQLLASHGDVGSTRTEKAGDFVMSITKLDKENYRIEILCSSASQVNDLRTLVNPDTYNHFQSINKRIEQQLLRIGFLHEKLKAAQPGTDFPALAAMQRSRQEVFPEVFPSIPKIPIPFESFSSAVRVKPS